MHPDPQIAADARAMLISLSMKMVLMAALGIIGGVVGRSRSIARKPIGVRTIAGYWLFGWAATNALHFFVNYLGYYLALRPYRVTLWLPQLMLLLVGVIGWYSSPRPAASRDADADPQERLGRGRSPRRQDGKPTLLPLRLKDVRRLYRRTAPPPPSPFR